MVAIFTECLHCMPAIQSHRILTSLWCSYWPFCRWGNWVSESLNNPQKVTQLVSEGMLGFKPKSNKECALTFPVPIWAPLCVLPSARAYTIGSLSFVPAAPSAQGIFTCWHTTHLSSRVQTLPSPLTLVSTPQPALSELHPPLFPTQLGTLSSARHTASIQTLGELSWHYKFSFWQKHW